MTCRPGHAPRHPDFERGNRMAETHGAWSESTWRPVAERLAAEALTAAPWLARPAFRWALEAWAVTEAKARLVDRWLDEHDLIDSQGEPRPAAALADRLHGRLVTLRGQLGLDPMALARLLATFAAVPGGEEALEALRTEGRAIVEARSTAALATAQSGSGDRQDGVS